LRNRNIFVLIEYLSGAATRTIYWRSHGYSI